MRPWRIGTSSGTRVVACSIEQLDRVGAVDRRLPVAVGGARHLSARGLAAGGPLGRREVLDAPRASPAAATSRRRRALGRPSSSTATWFSSTLILIPFLACCLGAFVRTAKSMRGVAPDPKAAGVQGHDADRGDLDRFRPSRGRRQGRPSRSGRGTLRRAADDVSSFAASRASEITTAPTSARPRPTTATTMCQFGWAKRSSRRRTPIRIPTIGFATETVATEGARRPVPRETCCRTKPRIPEIARA